MSKINKTESYKSLPHVYVLDSKFKFNDLGVYDKRYGIPMELGYVSGQFTNMFGKVEYDDSKYERKPAVLLTFKHKFFGNGSFGRNTGAGHYHEKYLVSTNEINLFTVYSQTKDGNIVFFADIVKNTVINGGEFSLVELKPHLESVELDKLKNDISEVRKWKEDLMIAIKNRDIAKADLFIANANAFGAFAAVQQGKTTINQLKKQNEAMSQVMLDVTMGAQQKLIDAIENVEENMDLDMQWHDMNRGLIDKSIGQSKIKNNFIDSLSEFKDGGMTESMKNYAVESVIEICGLDFVQNVVSSFKKGGNNVNSMTKINIKLMEMRDRGEITQNQFNNLIESSNVRAESNFANSGFNMNSAIQKTVDDLGLNLNTKQIQQIKEIVG